MLQKTFLLLIAFTVSFLARAQDIEPDTAKLIYSFFLIGDTGYPKLDGKDETLNLLSDRLGMAGDNSGVIFLGDNVYPDGLPPVGNRLRKQSENRLLEQLKILENYSGDVVFIPGNHDWLRGKSPGWAYVRRQEDYIEEFLEGKNVFFPDNGCPGPVEIELTDEITLIVVDTQWMLHPFAKPGITSDCENKTLDEVFDALEDALARNVHKHLIVAAHHPVYTYGPHGGIATLKQHIFPLTEAARYLYLPLPGLGSIYPGYRRYIGHVQDINHPLYKNIRTRMSEIFSQFPGMVYAAGHDHNLQYILRDSVHYLVSGAGSKQSLVKKREFSEFAAGRKGFAELQFFDNGKVNLSFYASMTNDTIFEREWMVQPTELQDSAVFYEQRVDFSDSIAEEAAGRRYEATQFEKKMLGENYRQAWATEVRVPFFDLTGFSVIKKGGGQATKSLRLEKEDGRQYVLRSVAKDPEKALPEELRGTFAADILQDQISATHPYGAIVIPPLAKAAGIYHTNPKLVYIPDDPRLGRYRTEFGNMLAFFEERPNDNHWQDYESFGKPGDIDSYSTVIENLIEDHDYRVDEVFVIRNRLFDLLIGDWDRHDDQWRWAQFDEGDGSVYRPIPRDRDQAFFINEGFLPKLVAQKWAMPKFQGFNEEVRWVDDFMHNARYFDRFFITEPSARNWLETAEDLQRRLTDEAIESAVREWPDRIFELDGPRVIERLKARRDRLKEYALEYYMTLAKTVNVRGSHKKEHFEVERLNDRETVVRVFKLKKDGETGDLIYDRTFITGQTKEVRLYGFGGDDVFHVEGDADRSVRIRIIGGNGSDLIRDESHVSGCGKKTIAYDDKNEGNVLQLGSEARDRTSRRPGVNDYNREEFKTNKFYPLVLGDYNSHDGLYIGAGAFITTYGFRKEPFASRHLFTGEIAPAIGSWDIDYKGEFNGVFGPTGLQINGDLRLPYSTNYFGLGNETQNLSATSAGEVDRSYYRIRYRHIKTSALFKWDLGQFSRFLAGPVFSSYELHRPLREKSFLRDLSAGVFEGEMSLKPRNYAGAIFNFFIDTRNSAFFPSSGVYWNINTEFAKGLNEEGHGLAKLSSEFSFYLTNSIPIPFTIANRVGGGVIWGEFNFFHANFLGEQTNLRGFRRDRFAGRNIFFNNTEVRVTLFDLKRFVIPGSFGILGFYDVGRVWIDTEASTRWHKGYGGGFWFAPLNKIVGSLSFGFSPEESFQTNLNIGYLF